MENINFIYVIKQLSSALRPLFDAACASVGLTSAQYTALTVLERLPGITSSELAHRSFVRAQTMARTLDPMIEAGLVRRERDPSNARRLHLYLTSAGRETIAQAAPRVREIEEQLVAGFDSAESAVFGEYLRRARRSLDAGQRRAAQSTEA